MNEQQKIQLLIVDDHPMVLEGLKAMLLQIDFVELTATATHAIEAIAALKNNPTLDVALVDINLPEISGIELTAKIKKEFPEVKVIAMSTFNERSYVSQMILNGAMGYLVKSASMETLSEAILSAYEGKMFISPEVSFNRNEQKEVMKLPLLTSREKEVLTLIAEGMTNPQIAETLIISQHTVESHRKNLLAKFEVGNTASLIKMAVKYNLI